MAPQSTGNERLVGPAAVTMKHAREQLLTGAGLTFDQNSCIFWRHKRDGLVDLDHRPRTGDHFGRRQFLVFDRRRPRRCSSTGVFRAFERFEQPVEFEWLGDVVERAALQSRASRFPSSLGRSSE